MVWTCPTKTGADGLDLVNPMINQAFDYLDLLDWTNGLLIHLNQGPIKKNGQNQHLDGHDGA